jgi:hypothetical protein
MVRDVDVQAIQYPNSENFKARRFAFLCIGAAALLFESSSLYAVCEAEARSACAANDQQCIDNAGTMATNAVRDCKVSVGRAGNAQLWIATQNFFDGQPQEKQYWQCVATACASASAP